MDTLKPCPFCGATPKVSTVGNAYTRKRSITIKCPSCRIERTDATLRHDFDWLETVAAQKWNQRPAPASELRIVATSHKDNNDLEVTDLYWFEENGVHDLSGRGLNELFTLKVYAGDQLIFESPQ